MPLPKNPTLIWKKLRKHGVLSDLYDLNFQVPLTGPSWSWVHSVWCVWKGGGCSPSCLWFFWALKLTIFSNQFWKVQRCHCLWMILLFVFLQSTSHMQKDLCNCVMKIGFIKIVLTKRLMQLCDEDWVSKNGFNLSTSKTICEHFCYQCKHFKEPSILLDKNPINIWLNLIQQQSCQLFENKLPYSSEYSKSSRPHQLGGRSEDTTLSRLSPCVIKIRLWLYCIWGSFKHHSRETGPYTSLRRIA